MHQSINFNFKWLHNIVDVDFMTAFQIKYSRSLTSLCILKIADTQLMIWQQLIDSWIRSTYLTIAQHLQ